MKNLLFTLAIFISFGSYAQNDGIDLRIFSNDLDKLKGAIVSLPKCNITYCGGYTVGGTSSSIDVYTDVQTTLYYTGKKKGNRSLFKRDYTKLSEQQFEIINYVLGTSTGYSSLGADLTLE